MRVGTHDCLVNDFTIKPGISKVKHGINIEWLSSGKVSAIINLYEEQLRLRLGKCI